MAQRIGQHKILGVAIGESSLVVAEAARAGTAPARVTQAATFAYPQGLSLQTPEPLGRALAEFLKSREFSARQVVVGVPARWVLSKAKEVPAADPDLVAEALRLQVEGEFSQELQNLVFDYAGQTSPTEPRNVLLVALQEAHVEQLKSLASAARLSLVGVTPVGTVLAAASTAVASGKARSAMVISVGPGGIELAAQDGDSPRALRHLGGLATSPAVLAGELRRAAFAAGSTGTANYGINGNGGHGNGHANGNGNGIGGSSATALVVWDDLTLTDTSRLALAEAAGARLEAGNLETLGVPAGLTSGPRQPGSPSLAGAAALAVAALDEAPLPVNFLRSRLAAPKAPTLPRRTVLITAAAVLAIGLGLFGYFDLQGKKNTLSGLNAEYEGQKKRLADAQAFIKRVGYAKDWNTSEPRFLGCLLALSAAIPADEKTFIVNLSLKENMTGTLTGRTTGTPQDVTKIVERMNKSGRFNPAKETQVNVREAGRGASDVAFTINFTYVPELPATQPAAVTRR